MTIGTQVVGAQGNFQKYSNTSTEADEIAIETGDVSSFDTFHIHCITGVVSVFASLNGSDYTTSPISLVDRGATTLDPVTVTTAGRLYGVRGPFNKLKLVQSGATDVSVVLLCGRMG